MKKNLFYVAILLSLMLITNETVSAQTTTILEPGDVAIVQFNSDSSYFSFVILKPILPFTPINFTSRGWKYDVGINYSSEEVLYWSNNTNETIPAGSVITMVYGNTDFSDALSLSTNGDQIFIFQGTISNPIMLFGINYDHQEWIGSSTNGNNSALPPTLDSTNSLVATTHTLIDNNSVITEYDNGIYKGITRGTPTELLAAIIDVNNWELSDGSLTNTLPTSFDTSPTHITDLSITAKTKRMNGYLMYLVLPIIITLLFYLYRSRRNFKIM